VGAGRAILQASRLGRVFMFLRLPLSSPPSMILNGHDKITDESDHTNQQNQPSDNGEPRRTGLACERQYQRCNECADKPENQSLVIDEGSGLLRYRFILLGSGVAQSACESQVFRQFLEQLLN